MTATSGSAKIEIWGQTPHYRWTVRLTAERSDRFVEVKVLEHLVVQFTPDEARDFAQALLKVASD